MIVKSIRLKEGFFERTIVFSNSVNLIHSSKNSCGKTTLLRFMLYALGYNAPNTRKIKFKNCEAELIVECETIGEVTLFRHSEISIQATIKNEKRTFVLPEQKNDLHKIIFGTENSDILNNLLGAFYVDQEKGWTLLNRGIVIGSIHFSIEALIRALSGLDCADLIRKETRVSRELEKYRQMFSIAQYRESLAAGTGELITESYAEEANAIESQLLIRQRSIKAELKRIDYTLSDNKRFKKYVADMKLFVQSPDGTTFPVTENNIVGLNDAIDLLIAKRKIISVEYATISNQLELVQSEKNKEFEQISFFKTATQMEIFDRRIANIPMNQVAIKKQITRLEQERKETRDQISSKTKSNNAIVSAISKTMVSYLTELGLGDKDTIPTGYLFTSNLKELSGANLHKTAFAFRLAYIIAIEDALKIKLPIILDSPSGKEVDQANIALMMGLLKRDFSDHQLIIASIFTYDFDEVKTIEIKERLIEIS